MWRDFKGSIYWDELAETCGNILRASGFQGNTVAHSAGKDIKHLSTITIMCSCTFEDCCERA